jgi:O-antigen ligase
MLLEPLPALPSRARPSAAPVRPRLEFTRRNVAATAGFIGAHVVLALVMRAVPAVSTVHALVTVAAGLVYAATTRRVRHVVIVVAYIAGCEVLWRMTKADVFHEFGKYASVAIMLVGLARIRWSRNRGLAVAYFGFLLPSIAITLVTLPPDVARQALSFNLSGPLTLAVCVVLCSNIRLDASQLLTALFALIGPVAGIAAVAYSSTIRAEIEFVNASNAATSGGFGPNQVSAVLGLAAMFVVFVTLQRRISWGVRAPLLALAGMLTAQSALTFSRGGIALAFAGVIVGLLVLLRGNMRIRMTVAVVGIMSSLLGKYVIEPRLDDLTNGKLGERYANTKSSGRDEFISSELAMFEDSPILGVGPGVGLNYRAEHDLHQGASHTEYTRMLGEHGIFGILSLVCLLGLGVRAVRQPRDLHGRAIAAALVVWAALFLAIYGTRVAAPAFVFGLAFAVPSAVVVDNRERHGNQAHA